MFNDHQKDRPPEEQEGSAGNARDRGADRIAKPGFACLACGLMSALNFLPHPISTSTSLPCLSQMILLKSNGKLRLASSTRTLAEFPKCKHLGEPSVW